MLRASERRAHNLPTWNFFSPSTDLVISCSVTKKLIIHLKGKISSQFIRGHLWISEGTPAPGKNSQMEEIFVRNCQVVGTRVFLGTRQVWGPASEMQAKVSLEACLPARKAFACFTWWASRVHRSRASPSLGLLWSRPGACSRFNNPGAYGLLVMHLGAGEAQLPSVGWEPCVPWHPGLWWGMRRLSILGKEKAGSSPVRFIKADAMISLSKPAFQGKFWNVYSDTEKGHPLEFPKVELFQLFWTDLWCWVWLCTGAYSESQIWSYRDVCDVWLLAQVTNFLKSK